MTTQSARIRPGDIVSTASKSGAAIWFRVDSIGSLHVLGPQVRVSDGAVVRRNFGVVAKVAEIDQVEVVKPGWQTLRDAHAENEKRNTPPPTHADLMADLRHRLIPSVQQRAASAAILRAVMTAEHVIVGLALPNKTRGLWTMDQEVHPVPGFWIATETPGDGSYSHARDAAIRAAKEWLAERGMTRLPAWAVINRDGTYAVFEGF